MNTDSVSTCISGIDVTLTKKGVKHLYLKVLPPKGKVSIIAPEKISDEELRLFVLSHKNWILKEQQAFQEQPRQSKREYINGETIYVRGIQCRLQCYQADHNHVELKGRRFCLYTRKDSTAAQRESIVNEWFRKELKKAIPGYIKKWEPILGVHVKDWGVKNMKTRWGTCNPDAGRIWLNLQLAKKPYTGLEYVIVHEMVHLIERKHNDKFREILTSALPLWPEIKKELNDSILGYMEE